MRNNPAQHCLTKHTPKACGHRRKGTILIVVLATSLIVSVLALGALMVRRVERRRLREQQDLAAARLYALAAVEMALWRTSTEANWRQNMAAGVWESDRPIGAGYYSFTASDPDDGDLTDADDDPVVIVATGKCGSAVQRVQVSLTPKVLGLSCLQTSLHADQSLTFNGGLQSDQTVSTNGNATQSGSDPIAADVEAAGTISLNNVSGTTTEGVSAREMPDVSSVFDYYISYAASYGTLISITQLPNDGSRYLLEAGLLSPQSNPFGSGNASPEGIYVVDCQGETIRVQNLRLVGTLVLLDVGAGSEIVGGLNAQPAVANYPVLMVRGDMTLDLGTAMLDEGSVGANFNPAGTPYPYPSGTADSDQTDSYPSEIKGLVYVSGNLTAKNDSTVTGAVVVGGDFFAESPQSMILSYDGTYLADPPPGFVAPVKMEIDPTSWRQVVD